MQILFGQLKPPSPRRGNKKIKVGTGRDLSVLKVEVQLTMNKYNILNLF
jgi:hypothetical protein